MRVLHLVHQYPPEFMGGVEFYTQTLAQQLAQHDHAVSVFVPSLATSEELVQVTIENGVSVYRAPIGPRSSTAIFTSTFGQAQLSRAWAHVLDQVRPDLVHVQHMMGLPVDLITTLQQRAVPFVVTLHDVYYFCANALLLTNYDQSICDGPRHYLNCGHCAVARAGHNHIWAAPFAAPVMAARNQRLFSVLRQARHLIAPTHFVAEMYLRQLRLSPDRLSVIAHGIAVPEALPMRQLDDRQRIRLVFIGGIAPHKGVHILIDAVNQLPAEKYQLDIYGDLTTFPAYAADLQQRARHPGITFCGKIPHDQIWSVLRNSDVLIVPSLVYESSSLIIQEAFAMQTPVVASDLGALRETALRGGGRLFPPGGVSELRDLLSRFDAHPEDLAQLRSQIEPVRTIAQHAAEVEAGYLALVKT
jgi:glycosyltransferase involved in cell wall biosynthesis